MTRLYHPNVDANGEFCCVVVSLFLSHADIFRCDACDAKNVFENISKIHMHLLMYTTDEATLRAALDASRPPRIQNHIIAKTNIQFSHAEW